MFQVTAEGMTIHDLLDEMILEELITADGEYILNDRPTLAFTQALNDIDINEFRRLHQKYQIRLGKGD